MTCSNKAAVNILAINPNIMTSRSVIAVVFVRT